MKRLPAIYRSVVLIGPLLVIAALIAGPFGCGSSSSGPAALPTFGSLEVGFVDSPSQAFQSLSPNIIEVRLNPTTNPDVLDTDPNWVTVSAPPGVTLGEVAVNLLDVQNSAVIFNTGDIPAQVYNQIELVIDASTPGIVIPSCASSTSPPLEGCITFNTTISGTTNLRFKRGPQRRPASYGFGTDADDS